MQQNQDRRLNKAAIGRLGGNKFGSGGDGDGRVVNFEMQLLLKCILKYVVSYKK